MNKEENYFKEKINYNGLEDNIYNQFAKTMAKAMDIDLAKTPLVDILTGYIRYKELEFNIEKAIEYIDDKERDVIEWEDKTNFYSVKDELLDILKRQF